MEWHEAVTRIQPHVVRITTPGGAGSGFLLWHSSHSPMCTIATAAHVVDHAHYWEQPLRIEHMESGKNVLLRPQDRVVFVDPNKDVASILFNKGDLPLPEKPFELAPEGKTLKTGNEIGWLGVPALPWQQLCFFSGRISGFVGSLDGYLVDGVAINGVSGCPAFFSFQETITLIGVVSAYIPNRATGEVLPGVSLVRSVAPLQDYVKQITSFDDAKKKETEQPSAPPITPAAVSTGVR